MAEVSEAFKARCWRTNVMGLSRPELAKLTGYSKNQIVIFESGVNPISGDKVGDREMSRYRTVCGAVMAGLEFDWVDVRLKPVPLTKPQKTAKKAEKEDA